MTEAFEVVIIGAGFSGIGMALRLQQRGMHDFVMLEQADRCGGTWRDNQYPGAACDVESHLYSFSHSPNPEWSREFATQPEILAYLEGLVERHGLGRHLRLGQRVTRCAWDEAGARWTVHTAAGLVVTGKVLVAGYGPLNRPQPPEVPGLERFEGALFHTARWRHDVPLEGRSVGVVGTGASAIQVVPAIAPIVGRLQVFQRTAPWIVPKLDGEVSARRKQWYRRVPALQRLRRLRIYWMRELFATGMVLEPRAMELLGRLALRNLRARVRDPALRARMTPDYTMGCKRILPTNDYLPAFRRSNVELVTEPITEVTARGVRTRDGVERPLDVLVLATGFEASEAAVPFELLGRDGRELNAVWASGAEAYLGSAVAGFPNFFLVVGPNTGLGHGSMVFMIEAQVEYIVNALRAMRARRLRVVELRPEALEAYNTALQRRLAGTVWETGCRSWYRTRSGKNTTLWPGFTFEFWRKTRRFDLPSYTAR
ncbi:MAG: NAD(P)/FAD-dependent oxidoreductase [Deltaproteobacteria bacterium]|nr:NAD(P)/FAD-dependent oxidoreductase [Deltaproteobacteria bacterium]